MPITSPMNPLIPVPDARKSPAITDTFHWFSTWSTAITWLYNQQSSETQRSYAYTVREFLAFHQLEPNPENLQAIQPSHIIAYREHLRKDKQLKPRTVRIRLSALSSLFDALIENQEVRYNPVRGVKRPSVKTDGESGRERGVTPAMTPLQARMLMDAPDLDTLQGLRDAAILHTLFWTGCRDDELGNLTTDAFFEDQGYRMLRFKAIKGGAEHAIEMHPQLDESLTRYLKQLAVAPSAEEPLFRAVKSGRNQGERLSSRQFRRIFTKYRNLLKLDKGYTVHSTRATFATIALQNGASLRAVQESLGHADPRTTMSYYRGGAGHKDSAVFAVRY